MPKIACTPPCKAKLDADAKVCHACGRSFPSHLLAKKRLSKQALTAANAALAKVGFSRDYFAGAYHAIFLRELRAAEAALREVCDLAVVEERVMIVTSVALGGGISSTQRLRDLCPGGLVEFLRSFVDLSPKRREHEHVRQAVDASRFLLAPEVTIDDAWYGVLEAGALQLLERAGEIERFVAPLEKRLKALTESDALPPGARIMARHLGRAVLAKLAQRRNDAEEVLDILAASEKLDERLLSAWIAVDPERRSAWLVDVIKWPADPDDATRPDALPIVKELAREMVDSHPALRGAQIESDRARAKEKKAKGKRVPWGIPSCRAFRMHGSKETKYEHDDTKSYEASIFFPDIDPKWPPWRLTVGVKEGGYEEQWAKIDRAPKVKTSVDMLGGKITFTPFDDYPDDAQIYWDQIGKDWPDDYDEEVYSEFLKKQRGSDWSMSKVSAYPLDLNEFFEVGETCDCGKPTLYVQLAAPDFPIADGVVTVRTCVNKKCKAKPIASFGHT